MLYCMNQIQLVEVVLIQSDENCSPGADKKFSFPVYFLLYGSLNMHSSISPFAPASKCALSPVTLHRDTVTDLTNIKTPWMTWQFEMSCQQF